MKRWIPLVLVIALCVFIIACGQGDQKPAETKETVKPKPVDPRVEKLAQFGKELKATAQAGVEVTWEKSEEIAKKLFLVLPKTTGELAGMEWEVSFSKNTDEKDMLFSANLNRKKGEETEQVMWFHILYNPHLTQEERNDYSTEKFEGYPATVAENQHLWILVNNMEIRAVADSDDFKNDAKIQAVLKGFALKDIEKL